MSDRQPTLFDQQPDEDAARRQRLIALGWQRVGQPTQSGGRYWYWIPADSKGKLTEAEAFAALAKVEDS